MIKNSPVTAARGIVKLSPWNSVGTARISDGNDPAWSNTFQNNMACMKDITKKSPPYVKTEYYEESQIQLSDRGLKMNMQLTMYV